MGTALFVRLSVCGSIYIYHCRALLVTGCTCIYAYNLAIFRATMFDFNTACRLIQRNSKFEVVVLIWHFPINSMSEISQGKGSMVHKT